MYRDLEKFKKWQQWSKDLQETDFIRQKTKAIKDAKEAILNALTENDKKSCEGILRKAEKMKFQFDKDGLISYGGCARYGKAVSFLPGVCQIETQHCFIHRKDIQSCPLTIT